MKRVFIIFLIAFAIFSCSNDETEEASASKIENVLNIKDEDEQRVAYGLLDENEKLSLWDSKLKTTLENGELTNNQKELIEDLRKNLKSSLFSDLKNDEKEYFKTIYVNNFLARAKRLFSYEQMTSIFYSLSHSKFENKESQMAKKKTCNCNKGSLFGCGPSCAGERCEEPADPNDCGFLWAYPCDGICKLAQPISSIQPK